MKKIYILLFFFLFSIFGAYALKTSNDDLSVICPSCGAEKALMSIISGNNFDATLWSDGYTYAPMLPELSEVQKCNECGNFFMLEWAESSIVKSESEPSLDTGHLSFDEMKSALKYLSEKNLTREEELALRLEFLYRYNDAFRDNTEFKLNLSNEERDQEIRDSNDMKLQFENIERLLELLNYDPEENQLLKAELYRESGKFDESLLVIDKIKPCSEISYLLRDKLIEKNLNQDSQVFVIEMK